MSGPLSLDPAQRAAHRAEERAIRKAHAELWASLTPEQRRPLEEYVGSLRRTRRHIEFLRDMFLWHLEDHGRDSGPDWLDARRQRDREEAEREQAAEATAQARKSEARRLHSEREAAALAAATSGEPVPANLRPVGGRCIACRRELTDAESVRLGIGPDCLARVRRTALREGAA